MPSIDLVDSSYARPLHVEGLFSSRVDVIYTSDDSEIICSLSWHLFSVILKSASYHPCLVGVGPGWFLEGTKIIDHLNLRRSPHLPSFHVVIPSYQTRVSIGEICADLSQIDAESGLQLLCWEIFLFRSPWAFIIYLHI